MKEKLIKGWCVINPSRYIYYWTFALTRKQAVKNFVEGLPAYPLMDWDNHKAVGWQVVKAFVCVQIPDKKK